MSRACFPTLNNEAEKEFFTYNLKKDENRDRLIIYEVQKVTQSITECRTFLHVILPFNETRKKY